MKYITNFKGMGNDDVRIVHRRAMRLAGNANHKRHNTYAGVGISNPAVFNLMSIESENNLQVTLASRELEMRGVA